LNEQKILNNIWSKTNVSNVETVSIYIYIFRKGNVSYFNPLRQYLNGSCAAIDNEEF